MLQSTQCAAALLFLAGAVCAEPVLKVGFLHDGPMTQEQESARAWLERSGQFAPVTVSLGDVGDGHDLTQYPVLWWHRDEQILKTSAINQPEVRRQLRAYVEGGGGLYLSLLAVPTVALLDIDRAPDICTINPDYDTPLSGVAAVGPHTVFDGLKRPVTNLQSPGQRRLPFARYAAARPKRGQVLGYGSMDNNRFDHEITFVMWPVGLGKVLSYGQYNLYFSRAENTLVADLQAFVANSLRFVAAASRVHGMTPKTLRNENTFIHEGKMQHPELELTNDYFELRFDSHTLGISGFRDPKDKLRTNFVTTSGPDEDRLSVGDMVFRYRVGADKTLHTARTDRSPDIRSFVGKDSRNPTLSVAYEGQAAHAEGIRDFSLVQTYTLEGDLMRWTATIRNTSDAPLEFGDIGFPLPWNERWGRDQVANYEQRVYRHTLLAQDGGYLYMQRPGGMGRILAMLPEAGSDFEIFRRSLAAPHGPAGADWIGLVTFYVHGKEAYEEAVASPRIGGNGHDWVPGHIEGEWFVPTTAVTLAPGGSRQFAFRFRWADDLDTLGDVLVDAGKVDVKVIPGMVVPTDLAARVAIRVRGGAKKLVPEFPDTTAIAAAGTRAAANGTSWQLYDIRFSKYGPNNIRVEYGDGRHMPLQFFVSLPWEETIERHAAFKAEHQLYRDPADGYDGAFLLWNQDRRCISHPKNIPGLPPFFYGTDDLGYGQALFLAKKNEIHPDADEIAALDYYLDRWIWNDADGKELQDHDTFGIWWAWPKVNSTGRSYNYPHLMNTYLSMYRIQKWYGLSKYLGEREYLHRAYRTAKALYELPSWEGGNMAWGLMCESTWPELIDALRAEGMTKEAREIEAFWTKKAERMSAHGARYPFGSEISIDSTAFEACHALARWRKDTEFIETIGKANTANRGHQPAWYVYAGDNRWIGDSHYQLSYMTQLGGRALLDYVLQDAKEPERSRLLRIAYAATTASWANIRKTDDENDGAANWVFHVENGRTGWAPADGEISIGFFGGLLAAASVVADDPIFGLSGYGCDVKKEDRSYHVVPKDGVRRRFRYLPGGLHLDLHRDHFESVSFSEDLARIAFTLENSSDSAHEAVITVTHSRGGSFELGNGKTTQQVELRAGKPSDLTIPLSEAKTQIWHLESL